MTAHFLNYEFGYIFLLCSLIFLIFSFLIKIKALKKTCIIFFSFFLSLTFVELILSLYMQKPQMEKKENYIYKLENFTTHQVREIKLIDGKGNMSAFYNSDGSSDFGGCQKIYDVCYTMFGNGFRYTKCDYKSKEAYVFLGCSFVFGAGVNDNETLPYFFSEETSFKSNVLNCGCISKASSTSINILQNDTIGEFLKDVEIKHFFYSFVGDHIERNFRIETSTCCMDNYKFINNRFSRIPQPFGTIKVAFARSYIFRKVFLRQIDKHNRRFYENYMIESLKEMEKIIKEKYKSKLTILVWKYFLEKDLIKKIKQTNLDVIFIDQSLNSEESGYSIPFDGHPTAKANKEIAQYLYNKYVNGY